MKKPFFILVISSPAIEKLIRFPPVETSRYCPWLKDWPGDWVVFGLGFIGPGATCGLGPPGSGTMLGFPSAKASELNMANAAKTARIFLISITPVEEGKREYI
jgi:hypothetical protein